MTIVVEDFWWNDLVRHLQSLHADRQRLSEFGVLLLCGNICIAAKAVTDGARVFDERSVVPAPFVREDAKREGEVAA